MTQVRFRAHAAVPTTATAQTPVRATPATNPAWLLPASLAYLGLPTLIFLIGWTRPAVAVLAAAACGVLISSAVRDARSATHAPLPRATTATIWAVAATTGVLTGAGGLAPQTWDWLKHNALLRDLVVEPWPVVYESAGGESLGLTYYIGYHLPAAAVGKVAGWPAANAALLVWTILGLVLALTWFAALVGPRLRRWMLLGFVGFSGLDIVGRALFAPMAGIENPILPSDQLDWWAVIGKFPNHLTSVMWAPHHAVAGWIATGIVLTAIIRGCLRWIIPTIALCALVSPFVVVGLVPLAACAVAGGGRADVRRRLRSLVGRPTWLAAVATAPVALYFAAKTAALPAPYAGTVTSGFALTDPIRPLDPTRSVLAYLLLVILEVGVFVIVLRRSPLMARPQTRQLLTVCAITLTILPLYRYGAWSDLAMRAAIPSMCVLAVLVMRSMAAFPSAAVIRKLLAVVLVVGLVAPLGELTRALSDTHANSDVVERFADNKSLEDAAGIVELSTTVYEDSPRFVAQHVAPASSFFFTTVAKQAG